MSRNQGLSFWRCAKCNRVVNVWDLQEHHGCRACGSNTIRPTNLTLVEKFVEICKHPAIWRWKDV